MGRDIFFNELQNTFPSLANEFDFYEGEHYNMERFADYTIEQIQNKNIEELNTCFNFIENRLSIISPGVENALNISFCEALLYYDDYKRGVEMKRVMPAKLFAFYKEYEKYYETLAKKKLK